MLSSSASGEARRDSDNFYTSFPHVYAVFYLLLAYTTFRLCARLPGLTCCSLENEAVTRAVWCGVTGPGVPTVVL